MLQKNLFRSGHDRRWRSVLFNHFNFKKFDQDHYLLTNDLGRYIFLSGKEFRAFLSGRLDGDDQLKEILEEDGFLLPDDTEHAVRAVKDAYLTSHAHLLSGTALHIFVLTNICNFDCEYCQAHSLHTAQSFRMTEETVERAVDIALSSPERYLTFEFQGGEPLANFPVLKHAVLYSEEKNDWHEIVYTVVTNLTLLSREQMEFFEAHSVRLSTSVDGPEFIHDHNRRYINGKGTHADTTSMLCYLRSRGENVGAIETTTRFSLDHPKEIVDEYVKQGVGCIFLRPLTPLGKAERNWEEIGYAPEEFLRFYREALFYILELSGKGIPIQEGHASLFLEEIYSGLHRNHMEFRSPCGGAIGQLAYNYDGKIYSCDEARMLGEMGDRSFCLGDVHTDSYDDLMESAVTKSLVRASMLETIPECCDCVYQPFCGTCPVVNYSRFRSLIPREVNDYRCAIYKGILDVLFALLLEGREEILSEFEKWVSRGT